MDQATYFDDFAAFYDAYYDAIEGDVEFYRDIALEADGPVLEVGCGTGRIYLELVRKGVDADGIDVSDGMLDVLRERAREHGIEPTVWNDDLRAFETEREYSLVIVPFRAFLHLTTVEDQVDALERIHDALEPRGRLVLNVFTPNYEVICEHYGKWEESNLTVDGNEYVHRTKTELVDEVEGIAGIRSEVREREGAKVFENETEIALVTKREFELLFRVSPFRSWEVYGGFEYDPLETSSQEMVWIAHR